MPVETDHTIRSPHDDVKVVANHQYRTPKVLPYLLDEPVECRFRWLIQSLRGFIEDQNIWLVQKRLGQQYPLKFST